MSAIMPFFSVVIPTYQRENVIEECVRSVLCQSFANFEVIVVDDGSTDRTRELLEALVKTDGRLRYQYQENAERSAARNHGIELAKGQYICFLDSDDVFLPNHLEKFNEKLKELNYPTAMIFCDSIADGIDGMKHNRVPELTDDNLISVLMNHSIPSQQVCIHSSILEQYKFNPNIRIGEDRELWFRLSEKYPIIHSNQATVKIRDLGDRSIDLLNVWAYQENVKHIDHLKKIDKNSRIPAEVLRSLYSSAYLLLAKSYLLTKRRPLALISVLRSFAVWPADKYKYKVLLTINIIGLKQLLPERLRDAY